MGKEELEKKEETGELLKEVIEDKDLTPDEMVTLAPDAYNALLDELDRLQELVQQKIESPSMKSVDDLASAAKSPSKEEPIDLDKISPKELANLLIQHIRETELKPLINKIEEVNVKAEIRELTRDGKNADFFTLKDEIYEIASRNPQLSLEQVLILAREAKKSSGNKDEDKSKKQDLLRNLPPRRTFGEKPTAARVTSSDTEPATRKDAVIRAMEDMKKAGKL